MFSIYVSQTYFDVRSTAQHCTAQHWTMIIKNCAKLAWISTNKLIYSLTKCEYQSLERKKTPKRIRTTHEKETKPFARIDNEIRRLHVNPSRPWYISLCQMLSKCSNARAANNKNASGSMNKSKTYCFVLSWPTLISVFYVYAAQWNERPRINYTETYKFPLVVRLSLWRAGHFVVFWTDCLIWVCFCVNYDYYKYFFFFRWSSLSLSEIWIFFRRPVSSEIDFSNRTKDLKLNQVKYWRWNKSHNCED